MIQDSEVRDGSSYTPMASSSKQNTNKPRRGVKAPKVDRKTEAIHAFRIITTMLAYINSTRGTADNRPRKNNKIGNQKELLRLLDALAAVLIRVDGVIAVTARPYHDGSGKVEVLASYLDSGKSLTISQPRPNGDLLNTIRNILISQNPRSSSVEKPVVNSDASVPNSFKKITDPSKLLYAFLFREW